MKAKYVKVIEEMLNDEEVKGKKWLRWVLWVNQVKPRFKEGDTINNVEALGVRVYGVRVEGFVGTISEVNLVPADRYIAYKVNFDIRLNNSETIKSDYVWMDEREMQNCKKCKYKVNVIEKKNDTSQSISVSLKGNPTW